MFHCSILRSALASSICLQLAFPACPPVPGFTDGFEAQAIDTRWALNQQAGSISLSTEQAYSGTKSLKFTSASGNQRDMIARYDLGALTKGTVSVAFFDAEPGRETLYQFLSVYNSADPHHNIVLGVMDFDSQCYAAYFYAVGPNANCGIYPQNSTTPIRRTRGWHIFSITYGATSVTFTIDGQLVLTVPRDERFDTIALYMTGPGWRPNTAAYFDDLVFTPLGDDCPSGARDTGFQVTYAGNLPAADAVFNIANTGAQGASPYGGAIDGKQGRICANIYAFSPDEQMLACCSCPVNPNGLVSLSAWQNILSNPITPVVPTSILVKLVGTLAHPTNGCANSALDWGGAQATTVSGLAAWGTTTHLTGSALAVTESAFLPASLSAGESTRLKNLCTMIAGNGSGYGICKACRLGAPGGPLR